MLTQPLISATVAIAAALTSQTFATEVASPQNVTVASTSNAAPIQLLACRQPANAVSPWNYDRRDNLWYPDCISTSDGVWAMLNAYRQGGRENVHWRYVTDPNNIGDCLQNWEYFDPSGQTSRGRFRSPTTVNDPKPWCPLKVYRSGGVQNKQWAYCTC